MYYSDLTTATHFEGEGYFSFFEIAFPKRCSILHLAMRCYIYYLRA